MRKRSIGSTYRGRPRLAKNVKEPCSPSTLRTNLSASGGSLVSSPGFCSNTVRGDVHIVLNRSDGAEGKSSAQEKLDHQDSFTNTVLRTVKREQNTIHPNRGKARGRARGRVTCSRSTLDAIKLNLQGNDEDRALHPPGGHRLTSLTGDIIGTRVTADYHCSGCSSAISSFKAKAFWVKCSRCRHSWKCAKLRCTCTAEITIELSDRSKRTVVLSDPLLRSIVGFETEGHCNTDRVEDRVLKVGSIRVDYVGGVPERVERITADRVDVVHQPATSCSCSFNPS